MQYNKIGKTVDVSFEIETNEWEGKYYTRLQAWMIKSVDLEAEAEKAVPEILEESEDLPF